jgi:hypothetical protein
MLRTVMSVRCTMTRPLDARPLVDRIVVFLWRAGRKGQPRAEVPVTPATASESAGDSAFASPCIASPNR